MGRARAASRVAVCMMRHCWLLALPVCAHAFAAKQRFVPVLLSRRVKGLGAAGDLVHVKPAYAENVLLPSGAGSEADSGALQKLGYSPTSAGELIGPRQLTSLISRSDGVDDLLDIHAQHCAAFDSWHIGAFWHSLGRHARREELCVEALQSLAPACVQLASRLPELQPRTLANVLHGVANLGLPDSTEASREWRATRESLQATLEERLAAPDQPFNAQELATIAWAVTKLRITEPRLFTSVACAAIECIDAFDVKGLSSVAWSFASANQTAPALFDAIEAELRTHLDELEALEPRALSTLGWAFRSSGRRSDWIWDDASSMLVASLSSCSSETLTRRARALATAGCDNTTIFDDIAAEVDRRRLTLPELILLAVSFATAAHPAAITMLARVEVEHLAVRRDGGLATCSPEQVANLA